MFTVTNGSYSLMRLPQETPEQFIARAQSVFGSSEFTAGMRIKNEIGTLIAVSFGRVSFAQVIASSAPEQLSNVH